MNKSLKEKWTALHNAYENLQKANDEISSVYKDVEESIKTDLEQEFNRIGKNFDFRYCSGIKKYVIGDDYFPWYEGLPHSLAEASENYDMLKASYLSKVPFAEFECEREIEERKMSPEEKKEREEHLARQEKAIEKYRKEQEELAKKAPTLVYQKEMSCPDNGWHYLEKGKSQYEDSFIDLRKHVKNGQEVITIWVGNGIEQGCADLTTDKVKEFLNMLMDATRATELDVENEMDDMDYED